MVSLSPASHEFKITRSKVNLASGVNGSCAQVWERENKRRFYNEFNCYRAVFIISGGLYWFFFRVRTNVCNLLRIFYLFFNMCQPSRLVKKINRTGISTRYDLTFTSGGGGGMMAELEVGRLQNLWRISRLCSNLCEVWSHQKVFNEGPQQFNVCQSLKELLCLNLTKA